MFFDPSESPTCCACSQMWVNFLLLVLGAYAVLLVGAWSYWFKNNAQAQVVNEWQNAVLTSVVWFHVALYLTAVSLTIFLRFQRSTLAIVPSKKHKWKSVRTQETAFEVLPADHQNGHTEPTTEDDEELDKQVNAMVSAAGIAEETEEEAKAENAQQV